jgi:hypothetical protein
MSSPQLTDANTSSEWFRTVAEPGASGKARSPSQAAIPVSTRPKRFVRLVTYTMAGLVAFTLLGVASFAIRQSSMQSALAAPVPAPLALATVAPESKVATPPSPASLAEAPLPTNAELAAVPPPPPVPVKKTALPAAKRSPATKLTKKPARSPFLSSAKATKTN